MTKSNIGFVFAVFGFILAIVGFGIREKGRGMSNIPDHCHVYSENGRYYYQKGNPQKKPRVEVSREQYDVYNKYNSMSSYPFFFGVLIAMLGMGIIFATRVSDENKKIHG